MPAAQSYDYVIVGAGSAGCVLANRLSADPDCSVLLVEAGGRDRNPLFRLPMLMGKLFHSGLCNWRYHTEPVPTLDGRSIYWPRGKVLGGSSTINGMVYVRGNRHDYDRWAQMGLAGWSYDDVLPAFLRSEAHVQRADEYHGRTGELTVCRARGTNPLFDLFLEAGREAGHPINDDFNGAVQEGCGRYDFTIRRGKRWSTSFAFLRPVLHRRNLTVATNALTLRVLVEHGRATGVELARGGRRERGARRAGGDPERGARSTRPRSSCCRGSGRPRRSRSTASRWCTTSPGSDETCRTTWTACSPSSARSRSPCTGTFAPTGCSSRSRAGCSSARGSPPRSPTRRVGS